MRGEGSLLPHLGTRGYGWLHDHHATVYMTIYTKLNDNFVFILKKEIYNRVLFQFIQIKNTDKTHSVYELYSQLKSWVLVG